MRVISHTEDDGMSIASEDGGRGLARIVASTSSQMSWVAKVGSIRSRGKLDLAIRTTIGASLVRKRRSRGQIRHRRIRGKRKERVFSEMRSLPPHQTYK